MKQPTDRDPRPAPGTRPPEYVAELWVSHQLKDKIGHLDPVAPGAAQAARHLRPPGPELEARAVATSHDHTNQPATSPQPTDASHRAQAAGRAEEHARAARSVDCECQARAGAPCGPAGDHLARYVRAHHAGALTKDSLKDVIAELDVIAPRALIQPPSERATPTEAATTAGQATRRQANAGMNADRAAGPAHSALAPGGEAPGRGRRAAPAIHAREEPELEAGS